MHLRLPRFTHTGPPRSGPLPGSRCRGIGGPQGAAADGAPTAERPDPGAARKWQK